MGEWVEVSCGTVGELIEALRGLDLSRRVEMADGEPIVVVRRADMAGVVITDRVGGEW